MSIKKVIDTLEAINDEFAWDVSEEVSYLYSLEAEIGSLIDTKDEYENLEAEGSWYSESDIEAVREEGFDEGKECGELAPDRTMWDEQKKDLLREHWDDITLEDLENIVKREKVS